MLFRSEANLALGHDVDEREFTDAVEILKSLGISEVILLTNNPAKHAALIDSGIKVKSQNLPTIPNHHNQSYLKTKRERLGHSLSIDNLPRDNRKAEER